MKLKLLFTISVGAFSLTALQGAINVVLDFNDTTTNWTQTGPTYSSDEITFEFSNPSNSSFRDQTSSISVTNTSDSLYVGPNYFYIRPDDVTATISLDSLQAKALSNPGSFVIWGMDDRDGNQANYTEIGTFGNITTSQPGQLVVVNSGQYAALRFDSATDTVAIDDMSFTIVPESSTYALLAGHLALCFVLIRRRRK